MLIFAHTFKKRYKEYMAKNELIQLFGEQKVRTKWDDEKQKWYFVLFYKKCAFFALNRHNLRKKL